MMSLRWKKESSVARSGTADNSILLGSERRMTTNEKKTIVCCDNFCEPTNNRPNGSQNIRVLGSRTMEMELIVDLGDKAKCER